MSGHSSGYYSIDEDYNIVGYNDTAVQLYPSLKLGEKCYKVLMGLDSPCPPCPVANGIHGPKTYLDPIRHIYETVDAVQTVHPDGSRGYALVFSTVDAGERLASAIPTGEGSLRLLGAVNLIASKYSLLMGVNLDDGKISVFRAEKLFGVDDFELSDNQDYEEVVDRLVNRYFHPEDRPTAREVLRLKNVRHRLERVQLFKVHCRVVLEGEVHYYYLLIARNGESDSFEDVVVGIACEDDDVNTKRIYEKQLEALIASIRHAAGYFHLDIAADKILKVGGTSAVVDRLNQDATIDGLMQNLAEFIPLKKDQQTFLETYNRERMLQDYESGRVEITQESRCYYDDNVARWSRYTLRLFANPGNGHLEGVFYGVDVTRDRTAYETQVSIVQALSSNYREVLLLNTREKTASPIKSEGFMAEAFPQGGEYPYDVLMENYVNHRVHPDDRMLMTVATRLDNVLDMLAQKQEYTGNYRIVDQDNVHHFQFRFIQNVEYGIVVLGFLNVDDIVAAEVAQQKKLQAALDEAKRANAEKSRFLARMSHDMRTPLNGIVGILEVDKNHADDVEFLRENRKKAIVVTEHLVSLVNDVLDMAKIEDGSLVLAHEAFDIMQEGREATVILGIQAQEAGITTEVRIGQVEPRLAHVYGSPLHLRRALMNIYSNCIKYNRKNGKITTDIQVVLKDEQTVVYRWTISDTGIGMSQEFLKRIFDPFVQENTDARSIYQGTGLGMPIAKAIIESMGGRLEISSELGVGSTFVVTIPFELADSAEIKTEEKPQTVSIEGMHILLVEDNDLNREIAQTLLEDAGAVVTSVVNGLEAVDMVQKQPIDTFDLVLMDVMMPVMDGYEATRQIRGLDRPDAKTLPIVAMTANAFAEDVQKSLEAGMNAHIAKPLDTPHLMRTIAQYRP